MGDQPVQPVQPSRVELDDWRIHRSVLVPWFHSSKRQLICHACQTNPENHLQKLHLFDEPFILKLTRLPGYVSKQSLGWITKYMPKNERDRYKTQPTKNDTGNQQISKTFVHHTCSKPWRKVAKVSCSSPIISGFTCKAPIISCASQGLHHVKSSEACFHFAKVFTPPVTQGYLYIVIPNPWVFEK